MTTDSRERMIRAAVELFAERGYAATSFHDVIERSGAPRGSIYHHFPGGKAELGLEALRRTAEHTARRLTATAAGGTSLDAVRLLVTALGNVLRASDFHAGCAVAGVVLDTTPDNEALLRQTAAAFASWRRALAEAFRREGATAAEARRLAVLVVAAVEGALMLARADRDIQPLTDVGRELEAHVRAVLRSHA